jgi:hypothetical protein
MEVLWKDGSWYPFDPDMVRCPGGNCGAAVGWPCEDMPEGSVHIMRAIAADDWLKAQTTRKI